MRSAFPALMLALAVQPASADVFSGHFVDRVVFMHTGDIDGGEQGVIGPPNASYEDLDGGAITLGFDPHASAFEYHVAVPPGTDAIIVDTGGVDLEPGIQFGYDAHPVDGDGAADGLTGVGNVITSEVLDNAPWDNDNRQWIIFVDFDDSFVGVNPAFLVAIVDAPRGDFDLNSMHVIPAPASVALLGLVPLVRRRPARPSRPSRSPTWSG